MSPSLKRLKEEDYASFMKRNTMGDFVNAIELITFIVKTIRLVS